VTAPITSDSVSPVTEDSAAPSFSTRGPVLIVGTGLLGTSLALALVAAGVEVQLSDTSPTSLALARDMGAGRVRIDGDVEPRIVVVATPPDVTASVVLHELTTIHASLEQAYLELTSGEVEYSTGAPSGAAGASLACEIAARTRLRETNRWRPG